jgi:hypothetical protein
MGAIPAKLPGGYDLGDDELTVAAGAADAGLAIRSAWQVGSTSQVVVRYG